jgi:hypothetical protein
MTDCRLDFHSPDMTRLRMLLGASFFALATTLASGCDRTPGYDLDDIADLDDDDADGIWARGFDIGDFLYEETMVDVWGDCTTTTTTTIEGNAGCSVGSIGVGIEQPDGTLVAGGIAVCGTGVVTQTHSSDECGDDTTTMLEPGAATFDLSAPREEDPIVLTATADDDELVISTTIFAASALEESGTAKTLRLDGQGTLEDGSSHRELSLVVDIVVQ